MKVIPGEETVSQHCVLLIVMVFNKKFRRKVKFRKKLKLWRLRESEVKQKFAEGVTNVMVMSYVSDVCSYTKPKHFEKWWWNKDVGLAVCSKRELFRIWKQSRNEEDRKKYCGAKKNVIRVVYVTVDQQAPEAVVVDLCCDGYELLRIARHRAGENRDIDGVICLKDES